MWREQAIIKWSWHVNSIFACCHSAKLCALAARTFRSHQYQVLFMAIRLFHLDNPDPVEMETISNLTRIQNNFLISGRIGLKSGLCSPLVWTWVNIRAHFFCSLFPPAGSKGCLAAGTRRERMTVPENCWPPLLGCKLRSLFYIVSVSRFFRPHGASTLYCCNLSVDVALNVWFTTNGMCAKNNTTIHICGANKQ